MLPLESKRSSLHRWRQLFQGKILFISSWLMVILGLSLVVFDEVGKSDFELLAQRSHLEIKTLYQMIRRKTHAKISFFCEINIAIDWPR